jgi:hypothetical protein
MNMECDDKTVHIIVKNKDGKNFEMTYASDKRAKGLTQDIRIVSPAGVKRIQVM